MTNPVGISSTLFFKNNLTHEWTYFPNEFKPRCKKCEKYMDDKNMPACYPPVNIDANVVYLRLERDKEANQYQPTSAL